MTVSEQDRVTNGRSRVRSVQSHQMADYHLFIWRLRQVTGVILQYEVNETITWNELHDNANEVSQPNIELSGIRIISYSTGFPG